MRGPPYQGRPLLGGHMGRFVGRKGVCVQGPPITALAWGVKQIDWQASGGQFQTLWSLFITTQSTSRLKGPGPEADPEESWKRTLAYSLNIHFHIQSLIF
ncbi:hypothetical protein EYF80_062210 [Liparis tanakae]|uniref:Uncharacterized protein n=1 Tax=Liparis tanakae TaxID=230148 RepID=A0A4Z2EGN9_9TELE|nr:hypothetical protein EYF80_062210 [Liparis tanakae]